MSQELDVLSAGLIYSLPLPFALLALRSTNLSQATHNLLASIFFVLIATFILSFNTSFADYNNYKEIFEETPPWFGTGATIEAITGVYGEPGYNVFNSILRVFTDDYLAYRLIFYSTVMIFMCWAFTKNSLSVPISIALLWFVAFYLADFGNLTRLAMASTLIFVGAGFFVKEKYLVAFLVFATATSFHVAAIAGVIPIVVYCTQPNRVGIVSAILVVAFLPRLIDFHSILPHLVPDIGISKKLANYSQSERYGGSGGAVRFVVLATLAPVVLALMKLPKVYGQPEMRMSFSFVFSALILLLFFQNFSILADRLFVLMSLGTSLFAAHTILLLKRNSTAIYATILASAILVFHIYRIPFYHVEIAPW